MNNLGVMAETVYNMAHNKLDTRWKRQLLHTLETRINSSTKTQKTLLTGSNLVAILFVVKAINSLPHFKTIRWRCGGFLY